MWPDHTAVAIGRLIGRTRNAVLGKADRLGLPAKRDAHPRKDVPARDRTVTPDQVPPFREGPDEGDGDRLLWVAVIIRAIEDATRNATMDSGASKSAKAAAQREARDWFVRGGADFQEVCGLAGLRPDEVRECALAAIRGGSTTPATQT